MNELIIQRLRELRVSHGGSESLAKAATDEAVSNKRSPLHALTEGFDADTALYNYVYARVRNIIVQCKITAEKASELPVNVRIENEYLTVSAADLNRSQRTWWAYTETREAQVLADLQSILTELRFAPTEAQAIIRDLHETARRAFIELAKIRKDKAA